MYPQQYKVKGCHILGYYSFWGMKLQEELTVALALSLLGRQTSRIPSQSVV